MRSTTSKSQKEKDYYTQSMEAFSNAEEAVLLCLPLTEWEALKKLKNLM